MTKEIPNIQFESKYSKIKGIEIITIESLIQRKENLDHFPEKAHQLDFYMLVFYTEGETEHLVDFVWHKVKKNTLFYLTKGQINAFKFNRNIKGHLIIFTEDYFKSQLNKLPKNAVIRLFTSHLFSPKIQIPESSNVPEYINLLNDEFYKEKNEFNKSNIINSLYTVIFSKLEQLKKHQTFYLKESQKLEAFLNFKSLIDQHFTESRNADFYAQKMNITYKHLNTICKEIVDITAKQFIDEFIILEAKRKLINSEIKSTELAYSLGFEEPTNFVKYFKKHTRLTPNSFKKQYI
ncbi:MAG: helix-turn-helix domain-containing protein [Flavobacteriaceae bacterium]